MSPNPNPNPNSNPNDNDNDKKKMPCEITLETNETLSPRTSPNLY